MAQKPYNIIKYEGGDNNVLVHKSQITDFKNESILIVDESQQALLYKDGQAEGPFKSGRHVLPTDNISKFRAFFAKLFSRRKDDSVPFTCDVFFVNTVNDVSINWGTAQRIPVLDPLYNEIVQVGANGNLKVKISDAMRFVVSINGRMGGYTLDRLSETVRSELMTVLKTDIATLMRTSGVSFLEIQTRLAELSESVERKLNTRLEDFGLEALHLNIMDISVDAESQRRLLERQRKINARSDLVLDSQAQTDADYMRTVRMADAKAMEREIQGYTYQDEQYWTTQQELAKNPRQGMAPPPMGYPGMPYPGMAPMGYPAYPGMMPGNQYFNPYGAPNAVNICPQCNNPLQPNAAFCSVCGNRIQPQGQVVQQQTHQYNSAHGRTCPKCGYPLTPRMTVCPNCDTDTEGSDFEK